MVVQNKYPTGVMVLGAVSFEGYVMSLHFFGAGKTVTSYMHIRDLEAKVKPWIGRGTRGLPHVTRLGWAPSYATREDTEMVCGEPAGGVDQRLLNPQLSQIISDELLCVERC